MVMLNFVWALLAQASAAFDTVSGAHHPGLEV
jgi:hypothetical protein